MPLLFPPDPERKTEAQGSKGCGALRGAFGEAWAGYMIKISLDLSFPFSSTEIMAPVRV